MGYKGAAGVEWEYYGCCYRFQPFLPGCRPSWVANTSVNVHRSAQMDYIGQIKAGENFPELFQTVQFIRQGEPPSLDSKQGYKLLRKSPKEPSVWSEYASAGSVNFT